MATSTSELILRFTGDPRHLRDTIAAVRKDLSGLSTVQVAAVRDASRQTVAETSRAEQRRVAETIKAANQRLREEQRAAKEVARILAETARQAEAQERVRERAAKQLADARIREGKRAAKELEKSLASGGTGFSGNDITGSVSSIANGIPVLRNFTSQFSSLSAEATGATSVVAGVAGAIGIMVAGAAVGIGILAKLGNEIFDLTKKTAVFQGKFFDLSQQVGISVETLSVLNVMAERTGGNIDTVSGSMAIFQKHLENAHDPTTEEAKLLKELGVTSLDTETALRQTLKGLFDLGEGSKQTDAALVLFGRSGRFVNAILKESKGNIDEAAKSMGLMLVSREAAAAADLFNDSLGDLNRTLFGINALLVGSSIPAFTVFFQDLNKGLTGNADDWSFWASVIEAEVAGVLGTLQGFLTFVKSGFTIDLGIAIDSSIKSLLDRSEKLRNKTKFESDLDKVQRVTQGVLAGRPGDRPDADKANTDAQQRAAKSIALQQRALEESTRVHRETLERERDKDLKSIDEWEKESRQALEDHKKAQEKIFDDEARNVHKFVKGEEDQNLALREIAAKRTKLLNDLVLALQKLADDAQKKRDQALLSLDAQLLKTRDAQRAAELQDIKADLDQGIIAESGAILRRQALLTQEFEDRNVHRKLELEQLSTSAERKIQLDNEKIESEINYTKDFKRLTQERIAAMVEEGKTLTPSPAGGRRVPEGHDTIPINIGTPPEQSLNALIGLATQAGGVFAGLGTILSDTFNLGTSGAAAFGDVLASTFGRVAQAVGSAVEAFILFGKVEGGFKKFAVEVISTIAQMAIVQAVWEGAQGLAMLALTWFTGNPKYAKSAGAHFAAAAAYGLIGGVAAGVGRAVAGNSFNQSGGGGTSGGGGSTGGGSAQSTTQPKTQEFDRNVRNQQALTNVVITIKRDPGSIVEAVVMDARSGGPMRQLIQSEIAS